MKRLCFMIIACAAMLLASCNHKGLEFEGMTTIDLPVRFDWRYAPDASPSSMAAVFFDTSGNLSPIYYPFAGKKGGRIRLPLGHYHAIGFNSDNDNWVCFRGTDNIDTYELYTIDAGILPAFGLNPFSVPRATEDERMAQAPEMIWNDRVDDIRFFTAADTAGVTFYPEEAVCHYSVTVLEVENLKYLGSLELDATLSGLAEGFYHGSHSPTDTPVTMPLLLRAGDDKTTLYGEFLNFGECAVNKQTNMLTIYAVFNDGTASYFSYNVTDQVRNAPDPRHVDIVVRGLHLPKPIVNGGGLHPAVEDWVNETVDLDM